MEAQRGGYLKDEYLALQNLYEDFDRRSLTIKGWVSAGSIAGIALGFGKEGTVPKIWWVVVLVALSIWFLEGYWKMFQYGLRDRIRMIEAAFRSDPDIMLKDPPPFQIYSWWFRSHRLDEPIYPYEEKFRPQPFAKRLIKCMCHPFVFIPYLPIVAISLWFLAIS